MSVGSTNDVQTQLAVNLEPQEAPQKDNGITTSEDGVARASECIREFESDASSAAHSWTNFSDVQTTLDDHYVANNEKAGRLEESEERTQLQNALQEFHDHAREGLQKIFETGGQQDKAAARQEWKEILADLDIEQQVRELAMYERAHAAKTNSAGSGGAVQTTSVANPDLKESVTQKLSKMFQRLGERTQAAFAAPAESPPEPDLDEDATQFMLQYKTAEWSNALPNLVRKEIQTLVDAGDAGSDVDDDLMFDDPLSSEFSEQDVTAATQVATELLKTNLVLHRLDPDNNDIAATSLDSYGGRLDMQGCGIPDLSLETRSHARLDRLMRSEQIVEEANTQARESMATLRSTITAKPNPEFKDIARELVSFAECVQTSTFVKGDGYSNQAVLNRTNELTQEAAQADRNEASRAKAKTDLAKLYRASWVLNHLAENARLQNSDPTPFETLGQILRQTLYRVDESFQYELGDDEFSQEEILAVAKELVDADMLNMQASDLTYRQLSGPQVVNS